MALPTLSGLTTAVYGTNASNAVSPYTSYQAVGAKISGSAVLSIANAANAERARRGTAATTIPTGYFTGLISASRLNTIKTEIEIAGPAASQAYNGTGNGINSGDGLVVTGYQSVLVGYDYFSNPIYQTQPTYSPVAQPQVITYPQVAAASGAVSFSTLAGSLIKASHINSLINALNNSRAVCTCNCNYCTCNCNYCTCNCNYACTCNCNYSDEQLKTEIEYM